MIRKRSARWIVTVYDRTVPGQKRWVGTYASRKDAAKAEAMAKLDRLRTTEGRESCDEFARRWPADYPRKRASTNDHNTERVAKFAEDFRSIPLTDVTRVAARRWALDNPGRYPAVRAMFTDAVRDGLCDINPFANMGLPQSKGRKNIDPPSMELVHNLAAKARELRGPNFEAFLLTMAYTGMRPGECYALQWPQIRFADSEIDVIATLSTKGRLELPKNGLTRRVVLPPPAAEKLAALPEQEGFVFFTHTGKRLTHGTISYQWDAVRNACGQPGLDLYMLRHAAAAYLLNVRGIPSEQVAAQLGHTDGGSLVRGLYGHPSELVARAAIKASYANVIDFPTDRSVAGSVAEGA